MDKIKKAAGIFSLGLLISCGNNSEYPKQLSTVDSLENEVVSYTMMMDSIENQQLRASFNEVDSTLDHLKESEIPADNKRFWVTEVGPVANMHKGMKRFKENEGEIRKQLEFSKKQLETLENSIIDEKLDSTQISQYVNEEAAAINLLKFQVYKNYYGARQALRNWENAKPYYDSLLVTVPK